MKAAIIVFGLFILAMAGWLAVRPKWITDFMLRNAGRPWFQLIAVAVRIVLGIVLLLYAEQSRFPLVLEILGWIAIVAAIVLALLPPKKFRVLIERAFARFGKYTRVAAFFAALFGAFLIYAVV